MMLVLLLLMVYSSKITKFMDLTSNQVDLVVQDIMMAENQITYDLIQVLLLLFFSNEWTLVNDFFRNILWSCFQNAKILSGTNYKLENTTTELPDVATVTPAQNGHTHRFRFKLEDITIKETLPHMFHCLLFDGKTILDRGETLREGYRNMSALEMT